MTDRLFPLLLVLTLLDLAFTHATGVVGGLDLAPLWVLAVASVWLRRLQRFRAYRLAWNAGVVVVFAMHVQHATTTGLLHMLEDGLVLAALCQVHLLNNVGERQRPDLIFFNSFLIAFVTSFFAPDLTWSSLFVAHAFVLVPALQMHQTARAATVDARLVRAVLRDAGPRTLAIGALTALVFVALPRDFRRDGWIGDSLALRQQFDGGLAERIRVDDEHTARLSDAVVARIVPATGEPEDVPAHWRGVAFSAFDGAAWSPQETWALGTAFATDPPWSVHGDGCWRRPLPDGARTRVVVELPPGDGDRLVLPLAAAVVALPRDRVAVELGADGGLRVRTIGTGTWRCTVDVAAAPGCVPISTRTRNHLLALPDDGVPVVVHDLIAHLHDRVPPGAGALAIAALHCEWLQHNRRYQLPGHPGFAGNLGEFLLGSGAGHCEYFATALALLLRVQGVPCRLAGGWLAHEWDADARAVIVRGKHAHAWVEVLDDSGAWHTFDPTPAADVRGVHSSATTWTGALLAQLERAWAAVTTFDAAGQGRWLAWLLATPVDHAAITIGVLLVAAAWLAHRRRRGRDPAVAALQRALRRARLTLRHGETPRELLARAAHANVPAPALARLRSAAADHEAARYARAVTPSSRASACRGTPRSRRAPPVSHAAPRSTST